MPRPGFIVTGQPKYFPVNADDGQPHYRRCKLNQELAAAKKGVKHAPTRKRTKKPAPGQEEIFK